MACILEGYVSGIDMKNKKMHINLKNEMTDTIYWDDKKTVNWENRDGWKKVCDTGVVRVHASYKPFRKIL